MISKSREIFANTISVFAFILVSHIPKNHALNQNIAATPPMGWSTWMVFQCYTKCSNRDQNNLCYSENSILQIADKMLSEGYAKAGYKYLILDDCWQSPTRTWDDRLVADSNRFPSTISSLSQFIHERGLKLGIFSDLGTTTGQGFPGSYHFLKKDAETFISWDVDYVKMSAASANAATLSYLYPQFGTYLDKSSKPIFYAVSWPAYESYYHYETNYYLVQKYANSWRYGEDIQPTWRSLLRIMDYYKDEQTTLRKVAGYGGWNDPDVLLVGNYGLSYDQSQAQMAVWCIIAAPLIISTDIRYLGNEYREILQNPIAIAIDQDALGKPGYRISTEGYIDVWVRKINPYVYGQYSYALAFVNRNENGYPIPFAKTLLELGLDNKSGYYVKKVFSSDLNSRGKRMYPGEVLEMQINPSGVVFYRAEITPPDTTRSINTQNNLPEIIRYQY